MVVGVGGADTAVVSWTVCAVALPEGDRPLDYWVDASGCAAPGPLPGAQRLPGRYLSAGLVDAHAHPAVGEGPAGPVALDATQTVAVLRDWARSGVSVVRDVGSPGGSTLRLDLPAGLPRIQAAGRFLAPPGQYFPALLPEGVPQDRLTEVALGELSRGAVWVKLIADFPVLSGGTASSEAQATYTGDAITQMVTAVHAAGGRVAAHTTTATVTDLVRAGVDSIEHGTAMNEATLQVMAANGTAWTPTLCAVLGASDNANVQRQRWIAQRRSPLQQLLPIAHTLGVPILAGTDTAGSIATEIALLAQHGLQPADALACATTTAYTFLRDDPRQRGRPVSLVTYDNDPREDLQILSSPSAVLIGGVRIA